MPHVWFETLYCSELSLTCSTLCFSESRELIWHWFRYCTADRVWWPQMCWKYTANGTFVITESKVRNVWNSKNMKNQYKGRLFIYWPQAILVSLFPSDVWILLQQIIHTHISEVRALYRLVNFLLIKFNKLFFLKETNYCGKLGGALLSKIPP